MKYFFLFERGVIWVEKVFVVLSCSIMCVTLFMQVLFRYVLKISAVWTQEVAVISFVFCLFMGASVVIVDAKHIGFDALTALFPKKLDFLVWVISNLIVMVFLIFMIWSGYKLVLAARTDHSVMLRIPMSLLYSIVPLSGCTMLLHTVSGFIRDFGSQASRQKQQN